MKKTNSLIKRTLLPILVLTLMAGCSKEKSAQKKITGKWNTTSFLINGTEEMKVWQSYKFGIHCQNGGTLYGIDKWILNSWIWEINEDGTAKKTSSVDIIDTDASKSAKDCKQVLKPQYMDNSSSDYSWELSSDGKTFTLKWTIGQTSSHSDYEVLELTRKVLRLKIRDNGKGEEAEFKLEKI